MATHGQRLRGARVRCPRAAGRPARRAGGMARPARLGLRHGDTRILADDHYHAPDHRGDHEEGGHDYEQVPLCSGREEIRAILEESLAPGGTGQPAIVAEAGDSLIVDPHVQPTLPCPAHQPGSPHEHVVPRLRDGERGAMDSHQTPADAAAPEPVHRQHHRGRISTWAVSSAVCKGD